MDFFRHSHFTFILAVKECNGKHKSDATHIPFNRKYIDTVNKGESGQLEKHGFGSLHNFYLDMLP